MKHFFRREKEITGKRGAHMFGTHIASIQITRRRTKTSSRDDFSLQQYVNKVQTATTFCRVQLLVVIMGEIMLQLVPTMVRSNTFFLAMFFH